MREIAKGITKQSLYCDIQDFWEDDPKKMAAAVRKVGLELRGKEIIIPSGKRATLYEGHSSDELRIDGASGTIPVYGGPNELFSKIQKDSKQEILTKALDDCSLDGGKGSGNWGHEGRPGKRGGSGEGDSTEYVEPATIEYPKEHSRGITKQLVYCGIEDFWEDDPKKVAMAARKAGLELRGKEIIIPAGKVATLHGGHGSNELKIKGASESIPVYGDIYDVFSKIQKDSKREILTKALDSIERIEIIMSKNK